MKYKAKIQYDWMKNGSMINLLWEYYLTYLNMESMFVQEATQQ